MYRVFGYGTAPELPALEVEIDTSVCVGNGMCVALSPANFEHDAARQSTLRADSVADEGSLRGAAEACPVMAIRVFRQAADGTVQLFPT